MRRMSEIRDENVISVIPEYGRQKLLGYAESFRELAELFEEEMEIKDFEMKDFLESGKDRQEYLWQKKLCESMGFLPGI